MFHKNSIEATWDHLPGPRGSCELWTTNFRIMWPSSETKLQVQGIVCIVSHKLLFLCNFFFEFFKIFGFSFAANSIIFWKNRQFKKNKKNSPDFYTWLKQVAKNI
jgi:hypothetical protein